MKVMPIRSTFAFKEVDEGQGLSNKEAKVAYRRYKEFLSDFNSKGESTLERFIITLKRIFKK